MYPLQAIVISAAEGVLPAVKRELLNVSAEIVGEFSDCESAIDGTRLHHEDSRLFVVHLKGEEGLESLRHLSGVFSGRPILVLAEGELSPAFMMHAMRDGAAQIVGLPFDPVDFREALDAIALQFGHAALRSLVIGVTSGQGGVGTTMIGANLAYEMAEHFRFDTLLIEMNPFLGTLPAVLNVQPQWSLRELFEMGDRLDIHAVQKSSIPVADRLSVITGPCHVGTTPSVPTSDLARFLDGARQLAEVVILDVPGTLDAWQFLVLDQCDEVVLVGNQTLPAIQILLECLRLGVRSHAPRLVINKYDSRVEGFDLHHLRRMLGVEELMTVARDKENVVNSFNRGQPLRLLAPHSAVVRDIDRLAETLLGYRLEEERPQKKRDPLHRLVNAFGWDG